MINIQIKVLKYSSFIEDGFDLKKKILNNIKIGKFSEDGFNLLKLKKQVNFPFFRFDSNK